MAFTEITSAKVYYALSTDTLPTSGIDAGALAIIQQPDLTLKEKSFIESVWQDRVYPYGRSSDGSVVVIKESDNIILIV